MPLYGIIEEIKKRLVALQQSSFGQVVVCLVTSECPVRAFAFRETRRDLRIQPSRRCTALKTFAMNGISCFKCVQGRKSIGEFTAQIPGRHNVLECDRGYRPFERGEYSSRYGAQGPG